NKGAADRPREGGNVLKQQRYSEGVVRHRFPQLAIVQSEVRADNCSPIGTSEQELCRARGSQQAPFGPKSVMDGGTRVAASTISRRFVAVIWGSYGAIILVRRASGHRVVHCTQRADDHRWPFCDRLAILGWISHHARGGVAVALQRRS